jgi:uncharacterized protein DUF736
MVGGHALTLRPPSHHQQQKDHDMPQIELTIIPADHSDAENAPNYRVHAGDEDGPEVGAGWTRSGEKAGEYVALQIDDPGFPQNPRQPVPVRQRSLCIPSALDASPKTRSTELTHVVATPTE